MSTTQDMHGHDSNWAHAKTGLHQPIHLIAFYGLVYEKEPQASCSYEPQVTRSHKLPENSVLFVATKEHPLNSQKSP